MFSQGDSNGNEIIEIEDDDGYRTCEQTSTTMIFVLDSDDEDSAIDVVGGDRSSIFDAFVSSPATEVIQIVDDELNDENEVRISGELIDLTEDESNPFPTSPPDLERQSSLEVQECPICLETFSDLQSTAIYLIITPCRHVFCTACSRQSLAQSPRCPLCRENVSLSSLTPYCILT